MGGGPEISAVGPAYNEEENIPLLLERLVPVPAKIYGEARRRQQCIVDVAENVPARAPPGEARSRRMLATPAEGAGYIAAASRSCISMRISCLSIVLAEAAIGDAIQISAATTSGPTMTLAKMRANAVSVAFSAKQASSAERGAQRGHIDGGGSAETGWENPAQVAMRERNAR